MKDGNCVGIRNESDAENCNVLVMVAAGEDATAKKSAFETRHHKTSSTVQASLGI